jgi:DNA-binding XRE family transcriptional regulator
LINFNYVKNSFSLESIPAEVNAALVKLRQNLALSRLRRKESQRTWAKRMAISVPTLIRLERGDSGVSMGIYAMALWMMGRTQALSDLADPVSDLGALEMGIRKAMKTKAIRSNASAQATKGKNKTVSK